MTLDTSPHLADMVRDNDLDLAIIAHSVDERGLKAFPVGEDEMVAILPSGRSGLLAAATPHYLCELDLVVERRQSVMKRMVQEWFMSGGAQPRIEMQLEHLEAIRGAVSAGLGAAIVPEILLRERRNDELTVLPLKPRLTRRLSIVMRPDRPKSDPAAILRRLLLESRQKAQ